jgi:hypothetical protein
VTTLSPFAEEGAERECRWSMTQTGSLREIFVVIVVIIAATVFGLGLGFVAYSSYLDRRQRV